jgi:hypothetical protein
VLGGVAQALEHLPSKYGTLSSKTNKQKKKKKTQKTQDVQMTNKSICQRNAD